MRTLLKATFDVEVTNRAIKNGSLPVFMKEIMGILKPESSYFYPANGKRACIMVFDMKDPSELPSIVEPFFMQMNAEVEITPVMDAKDLEKGLSAWMKMQNAAPVSVN